MADTDNYKIAFVKPNVYSVSTITKPRIGRVIIEECGNEGTEDTTETAERRVLLQSIMKVIEQEEKFDAMSDNMLISVYDSVGRTIQIQAGKGYYQFSVGIGKEGDPTIIWKNKRFFPALPKLSVPNWISNVVIKTKTTDSLDPSQNTEL